MLIILLGKNSLGFFTEVLRVTKLKGYVDMMVSEAQVNYFFSTFYLYLVLGCDFLIVLVL